MRSSLGLTGTWPTLGTFHAELALVENTIGAADSVDIDSYSQWREAVERDSPVIHVGGLDAVFDFAKPDRPVVIIDVLPGHLYIVRFSTDLRNMKQAREVAKVRSQLRRTERIEIPLESVGDQGFWLVERIQD